MICIIRHQDAPYVRRMSAKELLAVMVNAQEIINNITLENDLRIRLDLHPEGRQFLQIYQEGICNRTGAPYKTGGRKWDISSFATESEIVLTVFKAALTFVEHELREQFLYKGLRILDPHIDVNILLEVCTKLDVRNENFAAVR